MRLRANGWKKSRLRGSGEADDGKGSVNREGDDGRPGAAAEARHRRGARREGRQLDGLLAAGAASGSPPLRSRRRRRRLRHLLRPE